MTYHFPDTIPDVLFRAYDIRGPVGPDSLTPDLAYAIGLTVGTMLKAKDRHDVIVARDGRLTAPEISAALIVGLQEAGMDIWDIGQVPTAILYFSTHVLGPDSGVMVTASHNPKGDNGFKIVMAGQTLQTKDLHALYQRVVTHDVEVAATPGQISYHDVVPAYKEAVLSRITLQRPLHVVVDAGNGIAGPFAPQIYRALGCQVTELFCTIDGNFPNHHPDPVVPENMKALQAAVLDAGADIGLAFDGDADRIGVVTNKGEVIWPDRQMMLYASDVLSRCPGSTILFDVKSSRDLGKVIREHGGEPVMWLTGHSVLKGKLFELDAPLAGEMSGHIFFREGWFGFDDGIYVGARLMSIISQAEQSVHDVFQAFPCSLSTPEIKIFIPEDKKDSVMLSLLESPAFDGGERITIDGLRVEYPEGWGLVRRSHTSPNLTLRFEADTEAHLKKIQAIFDQALQLAYPGCETIQ